MKKMLITDSEGKPCPVVKPIFKNAQVQVNLYQDSSSNSGFVARSELVDWIHYLSSSTKKSSESDCRGRLTELKDECKIPVLPLGTSGKRQGYYLEDLKVLLNELMTRKGKFSLAAKSILKVLNSI